MSDFLELALAGDAAVTQAPLLSFESAVSLLTLTTLEIVLGIDNIVFISILAGKLPEDRRKKAGRIGLTLAMFTRILLLLGIGLVIRLTAPLFHIPKVWTQGDDALGISGKDLILLFGGLFLIGKSTFEIHDKLEGGEHHAGPARAAVSMRSVIVQILALDLVFSLDSVITAVGMARRIEIMIAAVVAAVGVMLVFASQVAAFVEKHPTIKMLALSFLLLIGVMLVAEGFHVHIPKGYVYFAMAFSLGVEMLNMRLRKSQSPVKLHQPYAEPPA